MQRDVVRSRIEFVQAGHADALLFGHRERHKRIMRHNFHGKGSRAPRYFHPDPSQPHDSQDLPPQFRSLERLLLPLTRMHERIGTAKLAGHGQHHAQRLLSHRHRVHPRRVHDGDALMRGGIEVDVCHVPAEPRPPAPPSAQSMHQRTRDAP